MNDEQDDVELPTGTTPPDTEEIGDSDSDSAEDVNDDDIVSETSVPPRDKRLPSLFYDANGELSSELGEVLFENTYFDRDELHMLYKHFITIAPDNTLSKEQFATHFAPFARSPLLVNSLFNAIDRNSDGRVQFYEYVTLLSMITRGSREEKLKIAFEICNLNGTGRIFKSDVLEVVTAASDIFSDMEGDIIDQSTPLEVVDSLFSPGRDRRLEKTDSATNVLLTSVKAGLVSTVGLLGVGGVSSATSDAELNSTQMRYTDVFDPSLLAPSSSRSRVNSDVASRTSDISADNNSSLTPVETTPISTTPVTTTPVTTTPTTTPTATTPIATTITTTPVTPIPTPTTPINIPVTTTPTSTTPTSTTPTSTTPTSTTPLSTTPVTSLENGLGTTPPNANNIPTLNISTSRSSSRRNSVEEDRKTTPRPTLTSLTWKDFVRVAELDPDLYRCFGMFDYFYYSVIKPIEVTLKSDVVRPGMQGHLLFHRKAKRLGGLTNKVSRRFFMITEGFFIQYHHLSKTPRRVTCLIGASVKAVDHWASSGLFRRKKKLPGFILQVGTWRRLYTTSTRAHAKEWVHAIRANAKGGYRYQSFAPVRDNNEAQFYVGGKEYFAALAAAIPKANHEIYIAGWWVKPETYLIRKKPLNFRYRLDEMLLERADKGVQIKILVWDETSLGITIGSGHTKSWLEGLHKNIHVVKHPKIYPLAWSHHQKMVVIDQQYAFVGGIDLCFMRYDDDEFTLVDFEGEKFPGKDYGNLNVFVKRTGDPMVDQIDRKTIPRLPWHDVTVSVQGLTAADVAVNFIQRWNHSIDSNSEYRNYPHLIPKPIRITPARSSSIQNLLKDIKDLVTGDDMESTMSTPNLPRRRRSRAASLPANKSLGRVHYDEHGMCEAQVVRSVCEWSAGQEAEDSCYKAYMDMISKAEHFIYIQNLYFISSTGGDTPKNRVVLAILRRVRRAIQNREAFKVVILLSVYPAGEIELPSTRMLIGWTMKTICRGGKSILEILEAEFPNVNVEDYISFYCLRSWQYHSGMVYTEEIYVHSKIMIVDDRTMIVGSCNINDRSMRGTRDSEICVIVRDKEDVEISMAGIPYKAGIFAHELRKRLWALHTGANMEDVVDPLCTEVFQNIWRATAIKNSEIFAQVFGTGIPENQRKLEPIRRSMPCDEATLILLQKTKGYLVMFPYHFLEDEYLEPSVFNKEWFVKTNVFI